MPRPNPFPVLALIALTGASILAGAEVYRWVDAAGEVHFGDRPPVDAGAQTVHLPPPPPAYAVEAAQQRLRAQQEQDSKQLETQQKQQEAAVDAAASAEAQQLKCRQLQENLKVMTDRPMRRIGVEQADGTVRRVTEDEWLSGVERTKQQIDQYCK